MSEAVGAQPGIRRHTAQWLMARVRRAAVAIVAPLTDSVTPNED